MSLRDLKTDLKSLKYGKDRPGGGDSGQPYQQVDINNVDRGFNRFRMTNFDDGLVRGGVVGAVNASVVDTFRIGKFLTDFPKGPLFIAKQIGLQLSNPKLETKKGVTGFFQSQPTRIYNLGVNTLAQVPVNAFGKHLNRHGLLPVQDNNTKYLAVARYNNENNNNRLVKLMSIIGNPNKDIDSYLGGSSSVYGIGKTTIRRRGEFINIIQDITENKWALTGAKEASAGYRINGHGGELEGYDNAFRRIGNFVGVSLETNSDFASGSFRLMSNLRETLGDKIVSSDDKNNPFQVKTDINYYNTLGLSKDYEVASNNNGNISSDNATIKPSQVDLTSIDYRSVPTDAIQRYRELKEAVENQKEGNRYTPANSPNAANQFNIYGDTSTFRKNNNKLIPISADIPVYYNGKSTIKINIPWNKVNRELRIGSGVQDQINLTPIFEGPTGTMGDNVLIEGKSYNINDLVKFRIQALNYNDPTLGKWMIFRAYITQFSDSVDASWNEIKYAGRGDKFYVYDGFSRKVSIGFKVAALSAEEMKPMYQKLNYLMGNLMGSYENGLLHGTLVKMTVGNWFDGQDGILNSLSYTVPQDSPWEIAINTVNGVEPLILPHVIEVSMTFTPIGSQTKGVNKISEKESETSHIAQNINDAQYITKFSQIG